MNEATMRARRDIIVVGGSTGAIAALQRLVADLPADLPAAVLVVTHIDATPSLLPRILKRSAALPVAEAVDGEPIESGRIYIAAPDRHLLVEGGRVALRRGPRENSTRPAIDSLFRSAAVAFGARVIGVILTGMLNDGTAGLRAIKRCGGVAAVQDPDDAEAPDMPRSALRHVAVDHCVPLAGMGALLSRLAAEPARPAVEIPNDIRREAAIATEEQLTMQRQDEPGRPSVFTCPDCSGTLWEIRDGELLRYRCHIGHAFTADVLLSAQREAVELAMARALRANKEQAMLFSRLADDAEAAQRTTLARHYRERSAEYQQDAAVIEQALNRPKLQEPAAAGDLA
jgi:two-component system chemotaxis response regulator CheB